MQRLHKRQALRDSHPLSCRNRRNRPDTYQCHKFHLMGHSLGGLTALLLANHHPDRVLSFVRIKVKTPPEDCFLSRQIFICPSDDPEVFLDAFVSRTRESRSFANALYASTLRARVRADAVRPIFESMVHLSQTTRIVG